MELLNIVDYAILGILGLSVMIAFFRGLISEALSLLVWIFAFIGAVLFYEDVGNMLPSLFGGGATPVDEGESILNAMISFAITFIAILILMGLVNLLITFLLRQLKITWPDRLLGALFGLLRGMFIVAIITLFVTSSPLKNTPYWQEARMADMATSWANSVASFTPKNFLETINSDQLLSNFKEGTEGALDAVSGAKQKRQIERQETVEIEDLQESTE